MISITCVIIIHIVEIVNTMFNWIGGSNVKRFTKGLVRHRVLVIIVCLALVIPSVMGWAKARPIRGRSRFASSMIRISRVPRRSRDSNVPCQKKPIAWKAVMITKPTPRSGVARHMMRRTRLPQATVTLSRMNRRTKKAGNSS